MKNLNFSTFKTELQNSLLSNINDDGDNNEKTKNKKSRVGMFKNMGGNIPGGDFLGGNSPGGNFPGGSFPDTTKNKAKKEEEDLLRSFLYYFTVDFI